MSAALPTCPPASQPGLTVTMPGRISRDDPLYFVRRPNPLQHAGVARLAGVVIRGIEAEGHAVMPLCIPDRRYRDEATEPRSWSVCRSLTQVPASAHRHVQAPSSKKVDVETRSMRFRILFRLQRSRRINIRLSRARLPSAPGTPGTGMGCTAAAAAQPTRGACSSAQGSDRLAPRALLQHQSMTSMKPYRTIDH